jgi:hypothetical protein
MKKLILGAAVALATLTAGAAMAQPYGYRSSGAYYDDGYSYGHVYDRRDYRRERDSDRDGIPDRREWNRDRDRDGRPDQYDRYDNRRHRSWSRDHHHRDYRHYDRSYDRYDRGGYRW